MMKKLVLALLMGVGVLNAGAQQKETIVIREETEPCVTESGFKQCLAYRAANLVNGEWQIVPGKLDGLNYEEGYRYTVLVERVPDESQENGFSYKLLNVQKKQIVATYNPLMKIWPFVSNQKWVLTKLEDEPVDSTANPAWIQFSMDDKRLFGSSGCNTISGLFDLRNKDIAFNQVLFTKKGCNQSKRENLLLGYLQSEPMQYQLVDNKYLIITRNGLHIFTFSARPKDRS